MRWSHEFRIRPASEKSLSRDIRAQVHRDREPGRRRPGQRNPETGTARMRTRASRAGPHREPDRLQHLLVAHRGTRTGLGKAHQRVPLSASAVGEDRPQHIPHPHRQTALRERRTVFSGISACSTPRNDTNPPRTRRRPAHPQRGRTGRRHAGPGFTNNVRRLSGASPVAYKCSSEATSSEPRQAVMCRPPPDGRFRFRVRERRGVSSMRCPRPTCSTACSSR